ncbi:MAG TPA: universal stress protein [Ilumatobacteraceae bacterium]|nr:universal stress protein [Ilumatobacteraceae bacterium]
MKHVLVGADGSAGAADAMRWASRLAARHGAELVVMTGFQPVDSELRPGRLETLVARQEQELTSWCEEAELDEAPVRTIVEQGDPGPALLAVAEREGADLIVVGRVGRSAGPGLLHLGSMAEWLAHHVDRPVAILSEGASLTTDNVLVAVDGSDGSRAAVEWVRDLAVGSDMRVAVASVDETVDEWTPDDSRDAWRQDLERLILDDYAAGLVGTGVDVDAVTLHGTDVADVLLQAARERGSDLVVVGARGLGGLTGLRIGGVALKTLHRADRPVVLVPPL